MQTARSSTAGEGLREEERGLVKPVSVLHGSLNAIQRHVFVLRFVENFNLQETARIVGTRINNVKIIQSRELANMDQ